jgi:shikimate kinase
MNIVLTGYRGTGKSSVGPILGEILGWPMIETDADIEVRAGKTIPQIFADDGEAAFRQLERDVVAAAAARNHTIIATGGGAIVDPENAVALKANGCVVLLQASAEAIFERISSDPNRPALTEHDPLTEIKLKLAERKDSYERTADMIIDTDELVETLAQRIITQLKDRGFLDK